jgi:hypothetical protein
MYICPSEAVTSMLKPPICRWAGIPGIEDVVSALATAGITAIVDSDNAPIAIARGTNFTI